MGAFTILSMPRDNSKSKRMILELLHHPEGSLTLYRIAKETGTNISWAIEFLRRLERKKLLKGTRVVDLDGLIDYYLSLDGKTASLEFHLPQALDYLKTVKREYALTTYAAENLVSHHLFPSRIDLYVRKGELELWKGELFRKGLVGKGNMRVLVPPDEYLFKFVRTLEGLRVVTVPLLMIDLKREGSVCMQAYEYLVEKYVSR